MQKSLQKKTKIFRPENKRVLVRTKKTHNDYLVTVSEYRTLLNDYTSADDQIIERLEYLESFCRNVAKFEIEKYIQKTHE